VSTWRVVSLVVGVAALAAGLGLGLPKLLSGDHDKYGRIPIPPGRGTVELPAGEVVVFYEEARAISQDEVLPGPQVDWRIRPAGGGEPLPLDGDGAGRPMSGRIVRGRTSRAWTCPKQVPTR